MRALLVLMLAAILLSAVAFAEVPRQMSYQGRLTDGTGAGVNGTFDMTFAIYQDSLAIDKLWQEERPGVLVTDGLFNVLLGSVVPITPGIFDGKTRWLMVVVDGKAPVELIPMVSVGYAYHSVYSDTAHYARNARRADTADYAISGGGAGDSFWQREGSHYVGLINDDDSVGIGTLFPGAKLEVEGDVLLDGGDLRFGYGDTWLKYYLSDLLIHSEDEIRLLSPDEIKFATGGGLDWGFLNPTNKTFGLGTGSPTEMLHLRTNTAGERAFLKIESMADPDWGEVGIRIETPDNRWHWRMDDYSHNNLNPGAISLLSQNSQIETMTWEQNGNVGIGTTNPSERLDVNGNALVNGSFVAVDGGFTGDLEVLGSISAGSIDGDFASNSINRNDIVDEPGVAFYDDWVSQNMTTSWEQYVSLEIDVPSAGYVVATGKVVLIADHGISGRSYGAVGMSMNLGPVSGTTSAWELDASLDAGNYDNTLPIHHVFVVPTAGLQTFHVVGYRDGDNDMEFNRASLSLVYIPTNYGTRDGGLVGDDGEHSVDGEAASGLGNSELSMADMAARIEALERRLAELEGK